MAGKFLDDSGLSYFWGKLKTLFNGKVDKVTGKGLSTEDYTTAEKTKLSGIDEYANCTICSIRITQDGTNPVTGGTIYAALAEKVDKVTGKGLSTEDYTTAEKTKLSGIEENANKTTVSSSITQYGTNPVQSSAIYTALAGKVDTVSGKGLSTNDYTTTEKNKLAGIDTGANKTTVDSSLSSTSTNPVQNKVINTALNGKVSTVSGKGLSTNDFTDTYKGKVDRLDSPLLSKNVAAYADSISTAGVYFARHATTPAYDQPVSGTRYYYIINVYSSNTASIMALPGQPRAIGEIYTRIKTEGTWGAWYKFTGTAV